MFYSENKKQYSVLNRRTFFLYLLKLSFFSVVGWRLFDIQIADSIKYKTLSKNNQIDFEIIFSENGSTDNTKKIADALSNKYSEIKIKWEEELIGKNSVIPWTRDKINISITF